jgi:hypothetical protein
MTWKLWLDDERVPYDETWTWAKSSSEAKQLINTKGIPERMDLDHDLGDEDTGMVFMKWLIKQDMDKKLSIRDMSDVCYHSQNPIGVNNMQGLLNSYLGNFGFKDDLEAWEIGG